MNFRYVFLDVDILSRTKSFANCSVIVYGSNEWVEMEVEEYGALLFVWAAARLTQHQQHRGLGPSEWRQVAIRQSRRGDR